MTDELERGMSCKMADVLLLPGNEIIKSDNLMALGDEPVAKM